MIKFDDQPPMSSAADAWAESVLIKSDKYRKGKYSNFFQYGPDKAQRIYAFPKQIDIKNIFLFQKDLISSRKVLIIFNIVL